MHVVSIMCSWIVLGPTWKSTCVYHRMIT